jgi:hypothetical protein
MTAIALACAVYQGAPAMKCRKDIARCAERMRSSQMKLVEQVNSTLLDRCYRPMIYTPAGLQACYWRERGYARVAPIDYYVNRCIEQKQLF